MPPPRYRVSRKDLDAGAKVEAEEHPTMGERTSRRTARQHLAKYGPGYYRAEPINEKIIENINKRMGARPIRKRRPAPRSPFDIGFGFRF